MNFCHKVHLFATYRQPRREMRFPQKKGEKLSSYVFLSERLLATTHSELRLNLAGKLTWLAQVCLTYGLQYMVYILSMNTYQLKYDVSLCCKVFKSHSKVINFAHQIQM